MLALAEELGLDDEIRFSPVGVGFWVDGEMYPFNGLGDFARFPPLSPLGRARLAWFVAAVPAAARLRAALEDVPLERWLRRHCGRRGRPSGSGSRCWTRASTAATTSCPRPTCGRARTGCAARAPRRGAGETMGCLQRRPRAPDRGARRRGRARSARHPRSAPASRASSLDGRRRHGRARRRRERALRPHDPDAAAARAAPAAARAAARPARRLSAALPRRRLPRAQGPQVAAPVLLGEHLRADADHHGGRDLARRRHRPHRRAAPGLPAEVLRGRARRSSTEDDEVDLPTASRRCSRKLAPDFRHEDVVDWTVQRAPLVEPVHALGDRAARRAGLARRRRAGARLAPARSTRGCSTATRSSAWRSPSRPKRSPIWSSAPGARGEPGPVRRGQLSHEACEPAHGRAVVLVMTRRLHVLRLALLAALVAVAAALAAHPPAAMAAVTCPNANPIVNENNCAGAGTGAYQLSNYGRQHRRLQHPDELQPRLGRAAQDRAQRPDLPGDEGRHRRLPHRLLRRDRRAADLAARNNVTVNNNFTCNPMDATTGELDCGNWNVDLHDPRVRRCPRPASTSPS